MRREGTKAHTHTNQTLRTPKCGPSYRSNRSRCEVHSSESIEIAYRDLLQETGKQRFSRKDLFERALILMQAEGPYRGMRFACDCGKGVRKANRRCSCGRCWAQDYDNLYMNKRREIQAEMTQQLEFYYNAS